MNLDLDRKDATERIGVPVEGSRLPFAILGLGLIVCGSLLLDLTSKIGFLADEWDLLILRPGWGLDQILAPFNGHPIMAPALIYKVLQEIFGMESARPMQVVAIATFLLMNVLLFIYLRRRVGDWAALIGTFLILFLGAAFEDLLWAFQIGFFGSLAAGIGALLALDRDDREGDIAASVLLVLSITFSSIGLIFVAASLIEWILNPRDRRGRWFVPGASMIFYAVWWVIWGNQGNANSNETEFDLSALPGVPEYIFNAFASGLTSLAGLATGDGSESEQPNLIFGQLAAVLLIGLGIWRLRVLNRVPRDFLVAGGALLALLVLLALGPTTYGSGGIEAMRPPTSSRHQLPIAIFIVLSVAALLRGVEIKTWMLVFGGALALLAVSNGTDLMIDKAKERWQPASSFSRATLTGIEAARPDLVPDYGFGLSTGFVIPAQSYYEAVDAHGSPAYSATEIRSEDGTRRLSADSSLIEASGIALSGTPTPYVPSTCRQLGAGQNLDLEPGRYVVINEGEDELSVNLARISDPPGVLIGAILPDARAGLDLPKGTLDDPWTISFAGEGPAEVCEAK